MFTKNESKKLLKVVTVQAQMKMKRFLFTVGSSVISSNGTSSFAGSPSRKKVAFLSESIESLDYLEGLLLLIALPESRLFYPRSLRISSNSASYSFFIVTNRLLDSELSSFPLKKAIFPRASSAVLNRLCSIKTSGDSGRKQINSSEATCKK